jgi:hypothetical protein
MKEGRKEGLNGGLYKGRKEGIYEGRKKGRKGCMKDARNERLYEGRKEGAKKTHLPFMPRESL